MLKNRPKGIKIDLSRLEPKTTKSEPKIRPFKQQPKDKK